MNFILKQNEDAEHIPVQITWSLVTNASFRSWVSTLEFNCGTKMIIFWYQI